MKFNSICLTASVLLMLLGSCNSTSNKSGTQGNDSTALTDADIPETMVVNDPHSFSKPEECSVTHLDWDIEIDFDNKVLSGSAKWTLKKDSTADRVIFDMNNLEIQLVLLNDKDSVGYELGPDEDHLGRALIIPINPSTETVTVHYSTKPEAEALMWLEPGQTAGGEHPFLFTQSQAILARTWLPCQDGPGIRYTYTARVKAPKGLMVAMSAENPQERNPDGLYHFKMEQPVPSYLMALVCGDLVFREIGDRTGVYAEPSLIEAAVYELGEMQDMLEAAESLYGPYRWERYDVVFLPPSFPFGGMENPRLTFATPTIIAGDRSLTALIAHELAHSWSGNLVTNATWNDFWLNEGFTVYFEQRIMEEIYGRDYSEMLALLSFQGLNEEIEGFYADSASEETHLKLDLKGRNPDDGLTSIAYDKGYLFLRMLEENYGRERFDRFLKKYFTENAFRVMTTERFVDYLTTHLLDEDKNIAKKCNINEWIYGPGLPDNCPIIESNRFVLVEAAISDWLNGTPPKDLPVGKWTAHEWLHFIRHLPEGITVEQMKELDEAFDFTHSTNNEILGQWFQRVARKRYEEGYEQMERFLIKVGRRKFLSPIYKELIKSPEGKKQALEIYREARPNYHAVSRGTIEKILGIEE